MANDLFSINVVQLLFDGAVRRLKSEQFQQEYVSIHFDWKSSSQFSREFLMKDLSTRSLCIEIDGTDRETNDTNIHYIFTMPI